MDHITPPPELVSRLQDLGNLDAIREAYREGADAELEGCCEWMATTAMTKPCDTFYQLASELRSDRRPKPPSLKDQALALINGNSSYLDDDAMSVIRRALESLPD